MGARYQRYFLSIAADASPISLFLHLYLCLLPLSPHIVCCHHSAPLSSAFPQTTFLHLYHCTRFSRISSTLSLYYGRFSILPLCYTLIKIPGDAASVVVNGFLFLINLHAQLYFLCTESADSALHCFLTSALSFAPWDLLILPKTTHHQSPA